ncbi:MAG: hypothetical protein MUO38_09915, partial [Anaerolineales bacterium]|nr:hypothetical protein [Anaerolineales bacterium]
AVRPYFCRRPCQHPWDRVGATYGPVLPADPQGCLATDGRGAQPCAPSSAVVHASARGIG